MVESARLESVYTLIAYRGFESLRLRQIVFLTFSKIFQNIRKTLENKYFQGFFSCLTFPVFSKTF